MKASRFLLAGILIGAAVWVVWLRKGNVSSEQTPLDNSIPREQKIAATPLPTSEWLGASNSEERDSILEGVLRYLCHTNSAPRRVRHTHKIYFLRVGESHDPPAELVARLSDLKCRVQPISSGRGTKFAFYDEASGEPGQALFLLRISRISRDEADVETRAPQHGTPFSGLTARIVYRVIRKDD
jgi:hypothetical protein